MSNVTFRALSCIRVIGDSGVWIGYIARMVFRPFFSLRFGSSFLLVFFWYLLFSFFFFFFYFSMMRIYECTFICWYQVVSLLFFTPHFYLLLHPSVYRALDFVAVLLVLLYVHTCEDIVFFFCCDLSKVRIVRSFFIVDSNRIE